jgi:hypothetical protein
MGEVSHAIADALGAGSSPSADRSGDHMGGPTGGTSNEARYSPAVGQSRRPSAAARSARRSRRGGLVLLVGADDLAATHATRLDGAGPGHVGGEAGQRPLDGVRRQPAPGDPAGHRENAPVLTGRSGPLGSPRPGLMLVRGRATVRRTRAAVSPHRGGRASTGRAGRRRRVQCWRRSWVPPGGKRCHLCRRWPGPIAHLDQPGPDRLGRGGISRWAGWSAVGT